MQNFKQFAPKMLVGSVLAGAVLFSLSLVPTAMGQVASAPSILIAPSSPQVESAFQLRDRWSVWAGSHRKPLDAMLQSQTGNPTPLNNLVPLLPPEPRRAEANISWEDLNRPATIGAPPKAPWLWLPSAQMADNSQDSAQEQEQKTRFRKYVQEKWRQSYEEKQDIVIAQSDLLSQKRVSLWASGRITESNLVGESGILAREGEAKQLFPPYAFLNSELPSSLLLSNEEKAKRLAQANELRAQWEKWADNHKEVLQKMLQAKGQDENALKAAWEALPEEHEAAGVGLNKFNGEAGGWTWQPLAKSAKVNGDPKDPKLAQQVLAVQRLKERSEELLRTNFVSQSDIALSYNVGSGPGMILWASGRITLETPFISDAPGQASLREGEPQELAAPFKFLTP